MAGRRMNSHLHPPSNRQFLFKLTKLQTIVHLRTIFTKNETSRGDGARKFSGANCRTNLEPLQKMRAVEAQRKVGNLARPSPIEVMMQVEQNDVSVKNEANEFGYFRVNVN